MKNLRKKISIMEEKKTEESSGKVSPPLVSAGRGRGRGRGPRGSGRGRGRNGRDIEDGDWSMKKYDFDAPDMKDVVEGHKPNFVKAPRRVFEKHDGYYSDDGSNDDDIAKKDNEENENCSSTSNTDIHGTEITASSVEACRERKSNSPVT